MTKSLLSIFKKNYPSIFFFSILLVVLGFTGPRYGLCQPIDWDDALDQPDDWYGTGEAVRIADNLLLYQHGNGGWYKNRDMSQKLSEQEKVEIQRREKESGTTIDNGATYTPMRFLARVYEHTGHERFKTGFQWGIDYLFAAQYKNGGWPQYYPIREGYYEHITFNDGAMIGAMLVLRDVANGHFSFVDSNYKEPASTAIRNGLEMILQTQIVVDGELTAWCTQYNHETLEPAWARAYEPPSISGSESVDIVRYLMNIDKPGPEVIRAVEGAVKWMERVKLKDIRLVQVEDSTKPGGRDIVVGFDPEGDSSLWGRFYEIDTNYPIFLGRDSVVRYALSEIEHERRVNYSWLGDWPQKLLEEEYPSWQSKWVDGK